MSVCLSVIPAVSGVCGAEEQQKTKFGPTYFVRLQLLIVSAVRAGPLHKPASAFKILNRITGAPIFSSRVCHGSPLIVRELRKSLG